MINFNLKCFLDAANELLRADETIRAIQLLDNLPGYYRANVPPEVHALKREIMSRVATASFYATSADYELTAPPDTPKVVMNTLRGALLLKDMQELNKQDLMPHLLDLAPGEYAFVRMLQEQLCVFTYQPSYVNHPSFNHYKSYFEEKLADADESRPKIYFAGEIIEHLWREDELRFEMERRIGLADIIHISTPNMTFDYMCPDWRVKGDLGHLRTYTPTEFANTIASMFPEYSTQVFVSPILHARCVLKSSKFPIPKKIEING